HVLETALDHARTGRPAGALAGVAAEICNEADGLAEAELGTARVPAAGAQEDGCVDLVTGELIRRGPVRFRSRDELEAFGASSHRSGDGSPALEGVSAAELRVLDVADTALPRAMEFLDPPPGRVVAHDGQRVLERLRGLGRQQPPLEALLTSRRVPLADVDAPQLHDAKHAAALVVDAQRHRRCA